MEDLFVLLGHPVSHSLSPVMHRAAFRSLGIPASYVALDVTDFEAAWSAVRRLEVRGGNVTVPWKGLAATALDMAPEEVRRLESANTFWRTPDGRIAGTETDGEGFLRALREAFDPPLSGLRVAVLGAGGGGRAVAWALARAGVAAIFLWNRTAGRAERLAATLREGGYRGHLRFLERGPAGPRLPPNETVDIVVNATSLGLRPADDPPADRAGFPGVRFAMDLIYGCEPTPFLKVYAAAGVRTADGRGMLLHQGARAFELWFDRPAPLEAMRSALADALRRA